MRRPPSIRLHTRGLTKAPAVLLAAVLVAAVALAGCGSGPDRSDAAAIVGDRVVTIDDLQQQVRVLAPQLQRVFDRQAVQNGQAPGSPVPPEVMAAQARRLLLVMVFHELIDEQGRREGVQATPQQVDAAIAALGGPGAAAASGYDDATFRRVVADRVVAAAIGRRYFDRLAVRAEYATVPDRAQANALAARVAAAPDRTATLFAGLPPGSTRVDPPPPQMPLPFLRPGVDLFAGDQESVSAVEYGLPAGTVTVVSAPSSAQSDTTDPTGRPWRVVVVENRLLNAPPPRPGEVPGIVPSSAVRDDEIMTELGFRLVQPLALQLGVTVNPRYGTWDPAELAIVSSPTAAGSVRPVAGAAQQPVTP